MNKRILIVDDEQRIASILAAYMKDAGFDSELVHHGDKVMDTMQWYKPDLVLLDLMLPGQDGLTLLPQIKQQYNSLVIMVTAKIDEIDRLIGLDSGADDYVCKPFVAREVAARVKNMLKRLEQTVESVEGSIRYKEINLDTRKQVCYVDNTLISLTPTEVALLIIFMRKPGKVFSRNKLIEYQYENPSAVSFKTIDNQVKNLREKLADALGGQELIHSIYGVGYKFE